MPIADRNLVPQVGAAALFLMFAMASCAPETPAKNEDAEAAMIAGPRLPPQEVRRFQSKSENGDVDAMYTLSTHHFVGSEVERGYYWLREAAKLGECHAILHLVANEFGGVTLEEMPHWRSEEKRLGCDPDRDNLAKPIIRSHPETDPAQ